LLRRQSLVSRSDDAGMAFDDVLCFLPFVGVIVKQAVSPPPLGDAVPPASRLVTVGEHQRSAPRVGPIDVPSTDVSKLEKAVASGGAAYGSFFAAVPSQIQVSPDRRRRFPCPSGVPSAGLAHTAAQTSRGNTLWCSCGQLLLIGDMVA